MAKIVLIGGTSHAGKSTLARQIAARLGLEALSTDKLARHPGRPWPTPGWSVPPHVAEHYSTLSPEELLGSVLAHYRRMWPRIATLLAERADNGLVLEGSALWPESAATLEQTDVAALWLTASDSFLTARIENESKYAFADAQGRTLIESFVRRTLLFNRHMMEATRRLGLPVIDVERAGAALPEEAMRIVSGQPD
jgi:2-phosphoglycerate kinase